MIYPANNETIDFAISILKEGKILVYPTDTLHGFGVDATNTRAIDKLNKIKGRTQPLSIIIEKVNDINKYAYIEDNILNDITQLFPGPYTVLLQKKASILSPLVTYGSDKIGIRIPKHSFPLQLVNKLENPIITTSINRHGNDPINNVTQVELDFPNIEIFEDNIIKESKGSTIIDFTEKKPKIFRNGDGIFNL